MEKLQLQQNAIMIILFQTLAKTSNAIALKQDNELLTLLKEVLDFASTELEKDQVFYSDLSPAEAEQEIKILDSLYFSLSTVFKLLFELLTDQESKEIKKEYRRLLDNMEDLREGLELYMDTEAMQRLDEIAMGDFSNFIHVA